MTLSCPHCGLQLAMSGPRHEYCPRCLAKRRQPVPLIASSLFRHAAGEGDARVVPEASTERTSAAPLGDAA